MGLGQIPLNIELKKDEYTVFCSHTVVDPLHQEYLTEAATSEALWELEGQMLARKNNLGQRMQEAKQCAAT